jgi:hypothetical protein
VKALAELKFNRLGKPSNYDEILLHKILYFVRLRDYRQNKADGDAQYIRKLFMVHGSPCAPTPLILILIL